MSRKTIDPSEQLRRESEMAKILIEHLRSAENIDVDDPDHDDLIADMVEGETNLHEAISKVIEAISNDLILEAGLKARITQMTERRRRISFRIQRREELVAMILNMVKISKFPHELCDLTVAKSPARVEPFNEMLIPADYWKRGDPSLRKRELLADLKAGIEIPGAQIVDNETHVRWKWS